MGGFVSRKDYHPVTTVEQLTDTPQFLTDISAIDVEDIKSKGDALSKGVALFQGLWFATVSCTRPPESSCDRARGRHARIRCCQCFHLGTLVEQTSGCPAANLSGAPGDMGASHP